MKELKIGNEKGKSFLWKTLYETLKLRNPKIVLERINTLTKAVA